MLGSVYKGGDPEDGWEVQPFLGRKAVPTVLTDKATDFLSKLRKLEGLEKKNLIFAPVSCNF